MGVRHYVLDGHEPVAEPDLMRWAAWFETAERHVAETRVDEDVWVSTVFLGIDHNWASWSGQGRPVLFETMVFRHERGDEQWRYRTWDEAAAGHKAVVDWLLGIGVAPV